MDISAALNVDANPKANLGDLLKILGMGTSDLSQSTDKSTDNADVDADFLQILQTFLNVFMKTENNQGAGESANNEDMSKALKMLLKEDKSSAGDLLSGLSLLVTDHQTNSPVRNGNDQSGTAVSALIAETGRNSSWQEEILAIADQTKSTLLKVLTDDVPYSDGEEKYTAKNGKPSIEESSLAKLNDKIFPLDKEDQSIIESLKEKVIAAMKTEEDTTEKKLQSHTASIKNTQENLSNPKNNAGLRELPEEQIKKTLGPEAQAAMAANNADERKKVVSESRQQAPPLRNAEGISFAEKVSGANQSIKISVNDNKEVVLENKGRLNISNETQNLQRQTFEDSKKNISGKQDTSHPEGQPSSPIGEAQKNITGKVTALPDEQGAMAYKIKADFKGKAVSHENNVDGRSLNTSPGSVMGSAKTTTGDILPDQIINRVAAEFRDVLVNEGGRVKITLAPPSLGTLEMDVIVRNSTVKVMIVADNKDVQQMLSGNLDSLKGSLQNQGLTIERCDVMMQDRREQYSQGFNQQAFNQDRSSGNNNNRRGNYAGEIKTAGSLTATINMPRYVISGVDKISLFV